MTQLGLTRAPTDLIVDTTEGPVQGSFLTGYTTAGSANSASSSHRSIARWQAIPYRAEPISVADRFSPPAPAPEHRDVLHADLDRMGSRATLSITAPAPGSACDKSAARLPVIIFIHGGRYESSHGDSAWYRGDSFATSGCVLVSVNYRYRFDGFLPLEGEDVPADHPSATGGDATTHPYFRGAEDILFALRWINRNIGAFGGDAENVTLMGQSAGGGLVAWTLADPRAADLIHRAVILSPAFPRVGWPHRRRTAQLLLGGRLNFDRVSSLTHDKVDRAYRLFSRRFPSDCAVGVFPFHPEKMAPVPLLVSTMRDEFVGLGPAHVIDRARSHRNPLRRVAGNMLTRLASLKIGAPEAGTWREWMNYADREPPGAPMGRAVSDSAIRRWAMAALEARSSSPDTWACEFAGGEGERDERILAQHCADLPLAFHCVELSGLDDNGQGKAVAPEVLSRLTPVAHRFHSVIVDFAHGKAPNWTPYDPHGRRVSKVFSLRGGRSSGECLEWDEEDPLGEVRRFFPRPYTRPYARRIFANY